MRLTRVPRRVTGMSNLIVLALPLLLAAWPPSTSAQTKDVAAAAAPPRSRITQAVDEKQLLRLKGNVHPLAQARFDQGAVTDAQPVDRMLLLLQRSPEQEAALRQLLEDQLTLNSPEHHAWLTPEEFGAKFGPADSDIQAATAWLNAKGFHDIKVGAGRTAIEFSGNAAQVRDAFHTELHHYDVNGAQRFANASDPQIPAALAPVVAGVVSLHNFPRVAHSHTIGKFQRAKDGGAIRPLFSYPNAIAAPAESATALVQRIWPRSITFRLASTAPGKPSQSSAKATSISPCAGVSRHVRPAGRTIRSSS